MSEDEKVKKDANKKEMKEIEYKFMKKKKKGWLLPLVIVLLVTAGISYFFFFNDVELRLPTESSEVVESVVDDDFLVGLRLVAMERYDEAISYFDKIRFNKLDESDKEIVIHAYIMAGEEQKALDLNPESDVDVVKKLYRFDELEKLLELETESQLIEFEIAILKQDYEKIIDYKEVERLEFDERIANEIANAYYELGDKEEAVNFTSLMTFDGINVWSNEWTGTQRVETNTEVVTKSSLLYILLTLISLMMNAFVLFVLYKKGVILFDEKINEKAEVESEKVNELAKKDKKKRKSKSELKKHEKEGDAEVDEKYSYHFDE